MKSPEVQTTVKKKSRRIMERVIRNNKRIIITPTKSQKRYSVQESVRSCENKRKIATDPRFVASKKKSPKPPHYTKK